MGLLDSGVNYGLLAPITEFITDVEPKKKRKYFADTLDLDRLIEAETDTRG